MAREADLEAAMEKATQEVQKLFDKVIADLQSVPGPKEGEKRLFFPNGIELIYVKVEAGLTEKTKVLAEVKLAGEKGIKGLEEASHAVVTAKELKD